MPPERGLTKKREDSQPTTQRPTPIDPERLERFLELQDKELDVRAREARLKLAELQLRGKQVEHGSKYSLKALDAQATDRMDERKRDAEHKTRVLYFSGFVVICALILAMYCIYLNKDQLVADLFKVSISLLAGGVGGYGVAATRHAKTQMSRERSERDPGED